MVQRLGNRQLQDRRIGINETSSAGAEVVTTDVVDSGSAAVNVRLPTA